MSFLRCQTALSSPYMEQYVAKGRPVLLMTADIDEFLVMNLSVGPLCIRLLLERLGVSTLPFNQLLHLPFLVVVKLFLKSGLF